MPSSLVNWSDHGVFVKKWLRHLFKTGFASDFEIKCNEKSYKVHKLVLGMFTDFFYEFDGLWTRLDLETVHMESILRFVRKAFFLLEVICAQHSFIYLMLQVHVHGSGGGAVRPHGGVPRHLQVRHLGTF